MNKNDPLPPVELVCNLGTEEHCITCSDAAVAVTVISVNQANGLALVEVQRKIEEVDVSLVDAVVPGDIVLVHAGIALGKDEAGVAMHE